ncbi:MAG: hypothetical protein Q4E06_09305 [Lautropia sp.]|nr:hypothetical protein [Lautropia sp.]
MNSNRQQQGCVPDRVGALHDQSGARMAGAGRVGAAGVAGAGTGQVRVARRRLLLAGGGVLALAGCGAVHDDPYYLDDRNDGAEIWLGLWRDLEIRLAVQPGDGLVTFLRSTIRPELRYRSGPDYAASDSRAPERGLPVEIWRFQARELGHTTIRMEYATHANARPARVLTFRVNVY